MILSELRARGWQIGCIAASAALLGALAWGGVQSYRLQVAKGAAAILATKYAEAERDAVQAARAEEQARGDLLATADRNYQRGLQDGKAAADNVLAGVADGTYVLRDKFRCPAIRAPGTSPGPGIGDGREAAILSDADVQFLVRFASEADDTVRQLTACQAVVQADRAEIAP